MSSYDGDEPKTEAAPEPQPKSSLDHVAQPISSETGPPQPKAKYDEPIKTEPEPLGHDQHAYSNPQNGSTAWTDIQGNGGQDNNNYGDAVVEEETRGIGIKEDG